jgi:uncharacterized protein (DUF305 family)
MKQNIILMVVVGVLVGGIIGYIIAGQGGERGMNHMMDDGDYKEKGDRGGMHMMPDGTMMGDDDGMMGGMDHSMMMVSSEREFLTGMIPHHQEAVDTAKEVVERGGSTPAIKKLAEDIIVAQEKEIAEMKQWYQDWYGVEYVAKPEDYEPMMRELAGLSGAELDKRFLEDMIMHHMGAIMMAESVQPYIEHKEIADLSVAIKETQSVEIDLMRDFLRDLN